MTYDSLRRKTYEQLLNEICELPKYRGENRTWSWVCENDPRYVKWLVENFEELDEDLREALEYGIR